MTLRSEVQKIRDVQKKLNQTNNQIYAMRTILGKVSTGQGGHRSLYEDLMKIPKRSKGNEE